MTALTLWLGIILSAMGIIGYVGSGAESVTALIPTFFGIPFIVLGIVARKEHLRKHMMHGAALLALIGFAGSVRGVSSFLSMLGGADIARPFAAIMQSLMAVLTLAFLLLAIKSFVDARRGRSAA
jgi:uncharacterized membrane protein